MAASRPVVGATSHDGASTIDLLHEHDQGQFVLERHRGKGPSFIRRGADLRWVPVRTADKKCGASPGIQFLILNPLCKPHAAQLTAPLI